MMRSNGCQALSSTKIYEVRSRQITGGLLDEVGESADKSGGIVERWHHTKFGDAEGLGLFARFDIDFVQRLDVFGDEGYGDDEHAAYAGVREFLDGLGERWLEPFLLTDAALVAQSVRILPGAAFSY